MVTHPASPHSRRFLAAEEPLVSKLRSIAKAKNITLYGLTNEILEQAVHAYDLGEELPDLINSYRIIKIAKENRLRLIPERIWYTTLEKALEKNGDFLKETFYDSGVWYGKYFSTLLTEIDSLEAIESLFKGIFWNASSLEIEQVNGKTILTCVEPNSTDLHTELLSTVFEGIMHSLGYQTSEKNVSRGLMMLSFRKDTIGKEEDALKER